MKASTRHEVSHVFNVGVSDQQFCESTVGQDAGASLGAHLNPIAAFVDDSATVVICILGSKNCRKANFLKVFIFAPVPLCLIIMIVQKSYLPFIANEFFACLSDKQQQAGDHYQYNVSMSAFEVLDEVGCCCSEYTCNDRTHLFKQQIVTDLFRPSSRGLGIAMTAEDGVTVQGLHKQGVISENQLRAFFKDTSENRASHTLPVGGSIDTSAAVWEIYLHQAEGGDGHGIVQSRARLLIVDVPSTNPLELGLNLCRTRYGQE